MVARFPLCQHSRLELAVANRLSEGETAELSEHVQTCPHCQAELEQLAGSREWWDDARTFLSSTADLVAIDDEPRDRDEPALDFLEPADDPALLGRLGNYRVEAIVGRGGMGIVLKAQDPALDRTVAIKLLATPLAASAAARKRFAREAKAAAAVVHDHVIPIHSIDTSGPVPFLVMPYVPGRSLQDRLDDAGPLETKEVLRIAMQTARGLAAAHAQGLVHRDIKPANILLENGVERVRITDFGLARTIDDASQSQSGYIAGTPQYMAPEQARGEPSDARADLFSLGSVMYAMCAGHPPFRAETTLAVLRRICDDIPRDLRQANPDVPEWLADIVHRLLAKSPSERFQSADEVADLLERWLAHLQQPTAISSPSDYTNPTRQRGSAKRETGLEQAKPWVSSKSIVAVGVSSALLLLVGWGVWRSGLLRQPSESPNQSPDVIVVAPSTSPELPVPSELPVVASDPFVSAKALDSEVQRAWQETALLESQFPTATPGGIPIEQELSDLGRRLAALEGELIPPPKPNPPSQLVEPHTSPLSPSN